jgi:hypothetical protein
MREPQRKGASEPARGWGLVRGGLLVLAVACGGDPDPAGARTAEQGLSPDRFVEVVAELREAERETAEGDSAEFRFEERRTEILDRYGATEEDLRRFVRIHAGDTELLELVWDSINERLKHQVDSTDDPLQDRPGHRVR